MENQKAATSSVQLPCSEQECEAAIGELTDKINKIKLQLSKAKLKKNYDKEWYAKACYALSASKSQREKIQAQLSKLRREKKQEVQSTIERAFMDAAMKVLPKETISTIWDHVHGRQTVMQKH